MNAQLPQNSIAEKYFATVSTFIQGDGWNEPLIHGLFPPYIAQNLITIPILTTHQEDARFWALDQKGKYQVRDGYKLEIGFYNTLPHCSEMKSKDWWKFV